MLHFLKKKFLTSGFKNGVSYFTNHSFLVYGIISVSTETFFPALGSFDYTFTSLAYFPDLLIELKCSSLLLRNKIENDSEIINTSFCFSLVCAVSYTTQGGEKMYFRKFFKFQVLNLMVVNCV